MQLDVEVMVGERPRVDVSACAPWRIRERAIIVVDATRASEDRLPWTRKGTTQSKSDTMLSVRLWASVASDARGDSVR